jgi:tRNA(His) guanylyltransferase
MTRDEFEALGNRHKEFEKRETFRSVMPGVPTVVRLDGRSFHRFCAKLTRPYDVRLSVSMQETMKYLVAETHAAVGYTQSDEITLVFPNQDSRKKMLFDGKIQKLCSVLAAMATAKFNREICERIPEKAHLLPVFDARVWSYPTLELAAENLLWRESDATRNSLTMAACAYYSQKELHKAGYAKKHEMLFAKGINWADYPDFFKKGTYARRESVMRELSAKELARIPEKHRNQGPVIRSVIQELNIPPLARIQNPVGYLFNREPLWLAAVAGTEVPSDD